MNILILGSGGREHALAWKCAQDPRAIRAADVGLASWWGKGSPRRRSVAGLRG